METKETNPFICEKTDLTKSWKREKRLENIAKNFKNFTENTGKSIRYLAIIVGLATLGGAAYNCLSPKTEYSQPTEDSINYSQPESNKRLYDFTKEKRVYQEPSMDEFLNELKPSDI